MSTASGWLARLLRRPKGRMARLAYDAGQLAVGLLIGVLLFDRVVMPRVVRQGWDATVPDLRGSTGEEAAALLLEARLRTGQILEVSDPESPAGKIISQDPPAGARVRQGRLVHLLVSRGASVHPVPDLAGKTLRSARLDLNDGGLKQGVVLTLPSDVVPDGQVIGTRPQKGGAPHQDGTVDLLVSGGPQKALYLMPDLRGESMGEARRRLSVAGIRVAVAEESQEGIVSEQDPAPGEPIASGESVSFN